MRWARSGRLFSAISYRVTWYTAELTDVAKCLANLNHTFSLVDLRKCDKTELSCLQCGEFARLPGGNENLRGTLSPTPVVIGCRV